MRLVVADTGPLNYLVLIGEADLLSNLFERVFIPQAVRDELQHAETPPSVREWIDHPPAWIEVVSIEGNTTDPDTASARRSCSRRVSALSFCSSTNETE